MAIELDVDPETIAVVPHGIRAFPSFQRRSSENSELTVVFLGRLERRKGTHVLLDAIPRVLTQLPRVRFVLIGHDRAHCRGGRTHQQYALEEYPSEMIKQVSFVANATEDEVNWQLQHADVFVAPSLYESFGLVFLEAMRWGTPVIGTTAGGIPEIIENGKSGILVTPGDDEGLASAIIGLLRDRQQREKLGQAGKYRVETEFTAHGMARRMADFYQHVINTYRCD
jgi:glycosyltransferase involved in cell wall biosynthesis